MERGSYPIFLESFFISFSVSALLGTGRGFHGYGTTLIREWRAPDRKGGSIFVVDIVFEGIEELKGDLASLEMGERKGTLKNAKWPLKRKSQGHHGAEGGSKKQPKDFFYFFTRLSDLISTWHMGGNMSLAAMQARQLVYNSFKQQMGNGGRISAQAQ